MGHVAALEKDIQASIGDYLTSRGTSGGATTPGAVKTKPTYDRKRGLSSSREGCRPPLQSMTGTGIVDWLQ
jgi:hypothetical protein